jgi:hypothetical protein
MGERRENAKLANGFTSSEYAHGRYAYACELAFEVNVPVKKCNVDARRHLLRTQYWSTPLSFITRPILQCS